MDFFTFQKRIHEIPNVLVPNACLSMSDIDAFAKFLNIDIGSELKLYLAGFDGICCNNIAFMSHDDMIIKTQELRESCNIPHDFVCIHERCDGSFILVDKCDYVWLQDMFTRTCICLRLKLLDYIYTRLWAVCEA